MGYVGLATAVCFADAGFRVLGVEIDHNKLRLISSGSSPIHETTVEALLVRTLRTGSFSISSDIETAVQNSNVTFLSVGTPSKPDGDIDLQYVEASAHAIAKAIRNKRSYHLLVIRSTVVPGTTSGELLPLVKRVSGKLFPKNFGICFNPEFLREGSAVDDTLHPDALIIGAEDKKSSQTLLELYKGYYGKKLPYTLVTTPSNAELVKYAVNTFRATQISFLNSLANLCEKIPAADISEVTKGLSSITKMDPRYQKSGFGFGGSCLPKDLRALIATFVKSEMEPDLLKSVLLTNENQAKRALEIARGELGNLTGRRISLLGLTFKAGTDDVRESVGAKIALSLARAGALVSVYDPQGMQNARRDLQDLVEYSENVRSCLKNSDCCIIATEWEEFKGISPSEFKRLMRNPLIIEGKRILEYEHFEAEKIRLIQVGRFYSPGQRLERMDLEPASESIMVRKAVDKEN
jgi:UDPglucose 6-dehydrogenase